MDFLYEIAEVAFSTQVLTALLICVVFVQFFWKRILEKPRYPPGPIPLPIIGNDYSLFTSCKAIYRYSKLIYYI